MADLRPPRLQKAAAVVGSLPEAFDLQRCDEIVRRPGCLAQEYLNYRMSTDREQYRCDAVLFGWPWIGTFSALPGGTPMGSRGVRGTIVIIVVALVVGFVSILFAPSAPKRQDPGPEFLSPIPMTTAIRVA
jgi:hypothetical protein